jgi:hypothetical protein
MINHQLHGKTTGDSRGPDDVLAVGKTGMYSCDQLLRLEHEECA